MLLTTAYFRSIFFLLFTFLLHGQNCVRAGKRYCFLEILSIWGSLGGTEKFIKTRTRLPQSNSFSFLVSRTTINFILGRRLANKLPLVKKYPIKIHKRLGEGVFCFIYLYLFIHVFLISLFIDSFIYFSYLYVNLFITSLNHLFTYWFIYF